jgi:hypothetical protein
MITAGQAIDVLNLVQGRAGVLDTTYGVYKLLKYRIPADKGPDIVEMVNLSRERQSLKAAKVLADAAFPGCGVELWSKSPDTWTSRVFYAMPKKIEGRFTYSAGPSTPYADAGKALLEAMVRAAIDDLPNADEIWADIEHRGPHVRTRGIA